ncbi:MAG: hypothetical protein IJS65_04425, partial [Clostridia bacterium]|nr:hypothetical protein [Clostridia bacterium]
DLGDYENHMFFGTDLISTFREWTESAFNIEGYKTVGIYLVSPDETRYVTDLDADSLIIPRKEYSTAEFTEAVRSSMDPEKASGVGKWPRNVYTDVIPEPALGTVESWYIENSKFVALMTDVRADEAQEYIDLFADMGFDGKRTKNGFSGKNEEGFKVKATFFDEQFEVSVEKP